MKEMGRKYVAEGQRYPQFGLGVFGEWAYNMHMQGFAQRMAEHLVSILAAGLLAGALAFIQEIAKQSGCPDIVPKSPEDVATMGASFKALHSIAYLSFRNHS